METTLKMFGNSVGLVIPKVLRDSIQLEAGQRVEIQQLQDGILIRPARQRKRYTLDELVAQCAPSDPQDADLEEWDRSGPVGHEIW